ncbi:MAG: tRNA lysidine(34) synthetase TilS [Moraxellaceae bacterium]|nr:tRNA lysidine(34) synthetase TilS [Moraxellaceae bacterium]MDZ4385787.1 tRNA lysidine(34) synthetase TilS [Moraxellaceae bacterium]
MNLVSDALPLSALQAFLQQRRQDSPSITSIVIALSAGPDSLALLLAAQQVAPPLGFAVRALHVHHGLHEDADSWAVQACAQAAALVLHCDVLKVNITESANIEAQARQARYDAMAAQLQPHEALLLAHHQDDQAETLLLRLMRGAGLQGLTAMAEVSVWPVAGAGGLLRWRPWLDVPKQALTTWLASQPVSHQAINDPANNNPRFDRTLLRHQVLPLLETRWPQVNAMLARSARQVSQQAKALNQLADLWLANHSVDLISLPISELKTLEEVTQQAVLARWLQHQGAPAMPVRYWSRLIQELFNARTDAMPELTWADVSIRRYRDTIYLLHTAQLQPLPTTGADWPDPLRPLSWAGLEWSLPISKDNLNLKARWRITARQGGERWRPEGRTQSLTVKHWCQENGIPPWQRLRLALVWRDDEIVFLALNYGKTIKYFK